MISLLLFCIAYVYATPIQVGVLEFRGNGIEQVLLFKLSDQSRLAALEVLPKEEYAIITRENIIQILSDMEQDPSCVSGLCEIETGRTIGADLIMVGDLLKLGETYSLTLKLYETQKGTLIAGKEVENSDFFALKNQAFDISQRMFAKILPTPSQPKSTSEKTVSTDKAPEPVPAQKNSLYTEVLIPSGSFFMGCISERDPQCQKDEKPPHKMEIQHSFYMMKSEVTQKMALEVVGINPSKQQVLSHPLENVSWTDALTFANKLSELEGKEKCYGVINKQIVWEKGFECSGWRLPTEAEWEYAARAGTDYAYSGGNNPKDFAWYKENSYGSHNPVCTKKENSFGLCDMSGNVFEWVWDGIHSYPNKTAYYSNGNTRVFRGGCYFFSTYDLRNAIRGSNPTSFRDQRLGFRLVRTAN